jgi:hypothetical protein
MNLLSSTSSATDGESSSPLGSVNHLLSSTSSFS